MRNNLINYNKKNKNKNKKTIFAKIYNNKISTMT